MHVDKSKEMIRKKMKGKWRTEWNRERTEGERTTLPYKSSFVIPPVMLLCFVYHEKTPLMLQPHQTADQVHEWHLSEPRVNPMIRGNLPKGLCS